MNIAQYELFFLFFSTKVSIQKFPCLIYVHVTHNSEFAYPVALFLSFLLLTCHLTQRRFSLWIKFLKRVNVCIKHPLCRFERCKLKLVMLLANEFKTFHITTLLLSHIRRLYLSQLNLLFLLLKDFKMNLFSKGGWWLGWC